MIPTFPDDFMYQVSSPDKVFNLLAVANMSEKTPLDLWGGGAPPFDKNLFRILKNEVRKKSCKGGCTPP